LDLGPFFLLSFRDAQSSPENMILLLKACQLIIAFMNKFCQVIDLTFLWDREAVSLLKILSKIMEVDFALSI
jgi:hypothetical protein